MKQSRTLFNSAGCLLALTSLLFNSSCSQEEIAMPFEDGQTRFCISLPGEMGTRSKFGDDDKATVNTLYWTLFEATDGKMGGGTAAYKKVATSVAEGAFGAGSGNSESVTMPLVAGKQYRIAFCAMNSGNRLVSYEDGTLSMHYENTSCNSVDDDVFTAVTDVIDMAGNTGYSKNIVLSRPLAQINWGSTDFEEDAVTPHLGNTKATVTYNSGLYSSLDLVNDKAEGLIESPISFPSIECDKLPEQDFPAAGNAAKLVAMNYVLTGRGESTVCCKINFDEGFNSEVVVNNVPVKANYRTNIYGGLITDSQVVSVEMNKAFETSNDERYLTPETQRIVNALNEGQTEIVIPAEETIDLTGLGEFQLTDGQHITINGTLILDSQQLVLNKKDDHTPSVDFDGNGMIYTTDANPVSINSGAKATFKGISIICEKQTTDGSALKSVGGEIELNAVTVKSTVYGISIEENGKLKADGCNILASTISNTAAINLSGAEESSITNCSLITTVGYAIKVKDSKVEVSGCKLDSYGDNHTIKILKGTNASFYNCEATSKYQQVLHAEGSSTTDSTVEPDTYVNIVGGSYHSESDENFKHAMEFKGTIECNLKECEVVSKGGSAVKINNNARVSIKSGTYVSLNHWSAVHLTGSNPALKIIGGEFVTDNKSAIERVNSGSGEIFIVEGGKYSAAYVYYDKVEKYPINTNSYEIKEIDEAAPYGLRFKYEIVEKNK